MSGFTVSLLYNNDGKDFLKERQKHQSYKLKTTAVEKTAFVHHYDTCSGTCAESSNLSCVFS